MNDHLEGILSDFEGMQTVIFNYFTAACFVGNKPKCEAAAPESEENQKNVASKSELLTLFLVFNGSTLNSWWFQVVIGKSILKTSPWALGKRDGNFSV